MGDAGERVNNAIEAFVRGFSFTRSFTHPYVAQRVGPLWVMRDADRKSGGFRKEEWVAYAVPPRQADAVARRQTRGRFAICAVSAVDEDDALIREGYKSLSYRLQTTEPLMVHSLASVPRIAPPADVTVERVLTQNLADRLAKAARSRQILPDHLRKDAPLRQYVALNGNKLVGWVRSVPAGQARWCSNMYVAPAFRRRGIARAMLCRMLRDDRAAGAVTAVLTASHAGARLYPLVGYEQVGTLLVFTPRKR